ncbi:isoleucine--tRNA ligase, partial [Lactobacillus sp. XV13L]|nr:isoleucine--tRNA ligase [Lactobacillus sp. XV13L]
IYPSAELKPVLEHLDADFRQILIVSKLNIENGAAPANAKQLATGAFVVERAEGEVCPRCRMIRTDVGADQELPLICGRCAAIVKKNYPEVVQEGLEE